MSRRRAAPRQVARARARTPVRGVGAMLVLALGLALPAAGAAGMYKWVDEKGGVHYSDKMPPDSATKASVQLSPQGIPVRKVDAAETPAQRKAREAELQQQRETRKQQEEAARRDKALLDSYTVEHDIDLARDRATRTVQAALQSALSYSSQLMRRRAALLEKRATYAGKPVPAEVEHELAAIDEEAGRQGEIIAQKNRQLAEIQAKYDADKERWHAIKGPTTGSKAMPVTGGVAAAVATGAEPLAAPPKPLSPAAAAPAATTSPAGRPKP